MIGRQDNKLDELPGRAASVSRAAARRWRSILPLLLLAAAAVQAQLPLDALEVPPAQPAAPQTPWLKHAGGSTAAAHSQSFAQVSMAEVAVATKAELDAARKALRDHLQGRIAGPTTVRQDAARAAGGQPAHPPSALPQLPDPAARAAQAQGAILRNFAGIEHSGWIPPDTVVAVGPEHVLEATNSGYAIYSKTGREIRPYTTMDAFFSALRPADWAANGGFMFDPKVYYDWQHEKFVLFTLGRDDVAETSHFFIAISRSAEATGDWWTWRFDWPESDSWVDYSSISSDPWGLYVTGNVFEFGGDFRYAQLWTLNPDMFNGGASNGWRFWDLRWPTTGDPFAFTLQAARPQSVAGGQESFFVNASSGSFDQLALWRLTGDRTSSPSLTRAAIATDAYFPVGENATQPDVADRLDTGDSRALEAVYSNRRVWVTLTSGEDAPTPSWAGMYTVRLNVDSNTNEWDSLVWSAGNFYSYPAITVAPGPVGASGPNLGLFASWSAADRYASSVLRIDDPDDSNTFLVYSSGQESYVRRDRNGDNRWGDYSGVAFDWTCRTLWGAAETAGTSNRWNTRIAEVDFTGTGACPRIDVTSPAAGDTLYAGNRATINWTRSNLSSGNLIYIFFYKSGVSAGQIAGPLAISTGSTSVTLPLDTTSRGQFRVGSWNPTTNSWETRDSSDSWFTLAAAPDLRISSFSSSASSVAEGTVLQFDARVANAGNGSSTGTTLRFYRSSNAIISVADTQIASVAVGTLAAGSSALRQASSGDTGSAGLWYFGACVDAVAHDPNANNCTATPIAVTVLPAAQSLFADGFE